MKLSKKKASGFSLIELLLVIGFIAGALVLAFVTYPKVQATNRANTEAQHITVIAGGIKNLYSTAPNFTSLTNQVLINSKVIPDDMAINGAVINNVWGGTVTVARESAAAPHRYTIVYTAVPRSECTKLATSVATNFLRLTVGPNATGGTVIFDRTAGNAAVTINPATIATACVDAGSAMTFTGN